MGHGGLIATFLIAGGVGVNPPERHQIEQIRARHFAVHYAVPAEARPLDQVDLWYTFDEGRNWTHYGSDPDLTSPFDFDAPREGLCGIYLILANASGTSGEAPNAQTQPHQWVFVDFVDPICQLHQPVLTQSAGQRVVQLRWSAVDANLDARPIEIDYRVAGQDEWREFARRLPNIGKYERVVPDDLRGDVEFRLTVRDQSGRSSRCIRPLEITPIGQTQEKPDQTSVATTTDMVSMESERPNWALAGFGEDSAGPMARSIPVQTTLPAGVTERDRLRALELLNRARRHADNGGLELAVLRYEDAVRINPGLDEALVELGDALYALGRWDESVARYDQLLARVPDARDALIGSARSLVKQHRFADAQERLGRIVNRNPRDAETWLHLGDIAVYRGDQVLAKEYYTKAATMAHEDIATVNRANERLQMLPALTSQYARAETQR